MTYVLPSAAAPQRPFSRSPEKLEKRRFSLMLLTSFAVFAAFAQSGANTQFRLNLDIVQNTVGYVLKTLF